MIDDGTRTPTMTQAAVTTHRMDRLLFGDNQFFGVNHMSEEKARAQQMRFQDLSAIMSVLDAAYDNGVRTFMCTTHDRVAEIAEEMNHHPDMDIRWRTVTFSLSTHSAVGVTQLDVELAHRIDAVAASLTS